MKDNHHPIKFPTHLRKMWSGGDVQRWLDANINQPGMVTATYDPTKYQLVPKIPLEEMKDAGAKAIVSWETGAVWPDSWGKKYAIQYRKDAEKAYTAMLGWLEENQTK